MKKFLYTILLLVPIMFVGCGVTAQSSGLTDQGYLEFVCSTKHSPVTVKLDNKTTFEAKVKKVPKQSVRGDKYAISTGKHTVKVFNETGELLYNRVVLIATQETKTILIPKRQK